MTLADLEALKLVYGEQTGRELMIWTAGGHYFRGDLREIRDDGFLVLDSVSCTLAGERHEREEVFIDVRAIDAMS